MNRVVEWIGEQFGSEPKLANKVFFEAFVAEIFLDPTLDRETLLQLADPIAATHTHQSETNDRKYSFFELLGPDYSKLILPAYTRVVSKFNSGKNPKPTVNLHDPNLRGINKEIYKIYDRAANAMIRYGLRR